MKTTEKFLQTIINAAGELDLEYRQRLAALPEPGTDVGELLSALANAEEHITRHFAYDWAENTGHNHADCLKSLTGALCPKCLDWQTCCREKDAAVAALVSYALALRAKREAA